MKTPKSKSPYFSFKSIISRYFSFTKVLTLVLILFTSLSFSQRNDKIAPAFLYLIDNPITKETEKTYPELFKLSAVNGLNPKIGKYESGYICIIYTKFPEVLRENGIVIQSTYPTYVTAWVTLAQIPIIAELNEVEFIEAPQVIMPNNDICVGSSGASLLHAGKINNTVYKGDGVIVAIVDSGIDWDHPDFRSSTDQTKSRILRIWDQTLTPITGEVSPSGFNYGVEYTQTQINNEIDGSPAGFVREKDINGHGTHVAGTAAGNGAALNTFKYLGVAPNADIVVVKGGNGSFTSTNIINSLTYLQNLATTLGKPIVVNMSLGGQFSAHDGTDPQEIAVDAFSNAAPGRVVVIAAGNDNGSNIHKQNSLSPSGNTTVSIVVPSASASTSTDVFQYTCYANDASAVNATITAPGGTTATVNAGLFGGFSIMGGLATVYFSNSIDSGSGDRKINVYVVRASTVANVSGTWNLTLTNATTNSLTIDGWLNYKGNDFGTTSVTSSDSNYLVATPGCANNAITVGSYMGKLDWSSSDGTPYSYPSPRQQDNISSFSSIGPRRDNVLKPEITANGQAVVSCLSSDSGLTNTDPYMAVNGLYKVSQGTSMATPEVAGCVALLLQINKSATYSQIKTALTTTATKDTFTTASDNNIWGSGKIDVFKAASSQLYCNTLNRVTYSYDAAYTATNNNQVNLGSLKATTRFTPAISGQLGGVYFKTGSVVTLTSFTIEVRTNSAGIPGTLLNSLSVTPSSVSKYSWNYYDLSSLNIPVTSGTDYFVVLVPGASSTFYLGQDPASVGRSFYYNGAAWIGYSDFRIRSVVYTTGNLSPTISLSSDAATELQSICSNNALTNITYATTGATGATFTGLPAGVTGVWQSNIVTISGTPTESGTFDYTVTLTVSCSTATASGTITVNDNYTITASAGTNGSISSPGVTTMSCDGTEDKTYTITPDAGYLIGDVIVDGISATALTAGSYAAGGTYDFTDVQVNHTISVTFALACTNVGLVSATATASPICANATTTLTYSGLTGTNASVTWWSNSNGTGTSYGTGTPSNAVGPGTYYAYATGNCGSAVAQQVVVLGNDLYSWTGGTGNWSTPANWSCGSVPSSSDNITISEGSPTLDIDFTIAGFLTISGTGGLTINPSKTLTITGTADFGGKEVIVKSDASGTASIGQVSGTLSNATNVTVERYIPAKRAWRLMTAPLVGTSNNSVFANWQNSGAPGDGATGLMLWDANGTATPSSENTGLFLGTQANMRSYNAGAWSLVTNTNTTPLFTTNKNNAFLVFVTGPHASTGAIAGVAIATTAKATGRLITGTVNQTLTGGQFKLIANPYPSTISTAALLTNNPGTKLWLINPSLGDFGAYATFDGTNWTPQEPAGADAMIQSGQGFFVRSASSGSFVFNESDKVSGSSANWFERNANTATNADKIRVLLYKRSSDDWKLADGILTVNYADGSNEVNAQDSNKISNFNESIMFRNNTTNLSIEHRALPLTTDIQPLRLTGTTAIQYQLRVYTENYSNSTLLPVLEDTLAGTFTAIPTDGSEVVIPFTGVVSTSTNPDNRFRIVYQVNLSTVDQSPLVASVYPNPVTNSQLNVNLGANTTSADYTITNLLGQFIQKGQLANTQNVITLSSVSQGFYILNVTQEGKSFTTKIYVQ